MPPCTSLIFENHTLAKLRLLPGFGECLLVLSKYSGNYVNGGFFVFNRNIFDYLEDRDDCDLEVGPLDQISQKGELMVYKHEGFWACMDTIRDTEHLNSLWNSKRAEWRIW